jgi:Type I restriction enzyme R protein N terminus (HSDR_N)
VSGPARASSATEQLVRVYQYCFGGMDWVLNFTRSGTRDKKLMPQQARRLLELGLWGIPESAQAKEKFSAGDRVLAFVGAPDRVFVGDAKIAAGWHTWTPKEARAYAPVGGFEAGLRLTDCRCWEKPLPIQAVWPQTQRARTNPQAHWYGATGRLAAADFDLIVEAALCESPAVTRKTASAVSPERPSDSDALFVEAERLKSFLKSPRSLNEDGTRAFLIDKWLAALGYGDFDDVEHGSSISSGEVPDYVLYSNGRRVMAVEAKQIGYPLGAKEAAQIVKYGSVLGLRWGMLTDGRRLQLYDIPVEGLDPEDRLVLSVDLAEFADREDFDTRIWPVANLLSKNSMQTGDGLERYAARELIRTLLTTERSAATMALKDELQRRRVLLSPLEIVALVQELIG